MTQTTDTPALSTPPRSKAWRSWAVLAAFGGILLASHVATSDRNAVASRREVTSSTGSLACGHARNVSEDLSAGVLTDDEARIKFAEIRRAAKDAELRASATGMLLAITFDDRPAFTVAVNAFFDRCRALGH